MVDETGHAADSGSQPSTPRPESAASPTGAGGDAPQPPASTPPGRATASGAGAAPSSGPEPTASTASGDFWPRIDVVLEAFAAERMVAPGSYWAEPPNVVEGRFVGWANASGWRCTLQLVHAPEEGVVVMVAQGPPLPGGRARVMVLGAFPPDFDEPTLRAALEVGYGIGETWGPVGEPTADPPAEPSSPPGAPPAGP